MKFTELLLPVAPNPILLAALLLAAMYLARKPFHRAVLAFSLVIKNALRLSAASVRQAEKKLVERNREVLMAEGLENAERLVEREFERINAAVVRDLKGYPALQRQMAEVVTKLEEDHARSVEVPPNLPNWINIIESIAPITHDGDSMVGKMLGEIDRNLREQNRTAIESFRSSSGKRQVLLNRMLPLWRKVQKTLDDIGRSISDLTDRAKSIDRYMDDYQEIRARTDKAARKLSSSSTTQFFIAGLVLLIAIGGAVINFNLIALPMSEMVGGGSFIGPYRTSDVAGLVIILIEISMGLFLMESLRITRLFPVIGSMDDKMRMRMIWITLTLLTVLAGVESALAFMRDRIASDMEALRQTLAGVEQTVHTGSKIPTIGQMIMGFILPFALTFVAIPLESFISSARTVLGTMAAGLLRIIAFLLRLSGNIVYYAGKLVAALYDLIIFPPLWLEGVVAERPFKIRQAFEQISKARQHVKTAKDVEKHEDRFEILESTE
ncbi:MAG: hypothetical protein NWQ21_04415 [Desulfobacterales bacterium]|nr:hypothetical protein [Desulfobacterales bacterium]